MADRNYSTLAWENARDRVTVYRDGMSMRKQRIKPGRPEHLALTKRGKITSFSLASTRRLRERFFFYDVPKSEKAGICLTVPMKGDLVEGSDTTWFKVLWNDFQVNLRRECPDIGLVYRIELQKRKTPHVHAVVYFVGDNPLTRIGKVWLRACLRESDRLATDCNITRYTVRIDKLTNNSIGYFRYLTDHASKHKRDQLGYQGKQWGVIGEKRFVKISPEKSLSFESEKHRTLFVRYFQKFNRLPVTVSERVGKKQQRKIVKYRRSRRSCGVSFCRGGSASVIKLFELARSNASLKGAVD